MMKKTTTSVGPDGSLKKMEEQETRDPGERPWRDTRLPRAPQPSLASEEGENGVMPNHSRKRGRDRESRHSTNTNTQERTDVVEARSALLVYAEAPGNGGTAFTAPNPSASYRPSATPPGRGKKRKERICIYEKDLGGRSSAVGTEYMCVLALSSQPPLMNLAISEYATPTQPNRQYRTRTRGTHIILRTKFDRLSRSSSHPDKENQTLPSIYLSPKNSKKKLRIERKNE